MFVNGNNLMEDLDYVDILNGTVRVTRESILAKAHYKSEDIVLLSGTLIEGIGNAHSDLDCLVICNRRPRISELKRTNALVADAAYAPLTQDGEVHNTTDYFGRSSIHIDFDYITFEEIAELLARIETLYRDLREDQRILFDPLLGTKETRIFHRLVIARAVRNAAAFAPLRCRLPIHAFCYIAFRECLPDYYTFKDVQGAWNAGEYWMARDIARGMTIRHTQAYLHLLLETNRNAKWLYANTRKHSSAEFLLDRKFQAIMSIGAEHEEECRDHIIRMLAFMDELYARTPALVENRPEFPRVAAAAEALEKEFLARRDTNHVLSREEFEYRMKSYAPTEGRSLARMVTDWESRG
jgi:hypothetical protein